jgi:hypothetical protein
VSERTICDEIASDAPGLMAMPPDAPERKRAEEHARTHADCARALDEARQLLALIGGKPMPSPSSAAMERAAAPVLRSLEAATHFAGLVAAIVIVAWALPLAMMRAHLAGPDFYVSIALATLAALTSALVVVRAGRTGLIFVGLSALAAVLPGDGSGGLEGALGLHCALTEALVAAGAATGAFLYGLRGSRSFRDPRALAAALGGGALAGHAALEVGCRAAHSLSHSLIFHTLPVALAVALASWLTRAAARRALTSPI